MRKLKNAAVIITAVEAARQWAHNNPEQAAKYIDSASGFVDTRTKGKYSRQIAGFTSTAKKNLTGTDTVRGSTVHDQAPPKPQGSKPTFPDGRL